jgi:hypothetical protein
MYTIEMTAGELNHDLIMIKLTGTGAADSAIVIKTTAVDIEDLVRATTPGNTLDVEAGGTVGIDFSNINGSHPTVATVTDVSNDVGITQAGADKVWSTAARALTDKAGFSLSSAGIQAIWDALTSALTTPGSIGKLLVDNINAAISSRSSHAAADIWSVGTRTLTAGTKDSEIDAIKAKTDNLPDGVLKNTALNNFQFFMVDSADHVTGKTLLSITAQRSIDGAAFAACANAAAEMSGGMYKINLAASDLNGDVITFKFSGTDADDRFITVLTQS